MVTGPVLAEDLLAGDRRALARAISVVEEGRDERDELLAAIASKVGRARRFGVTGPPGVGKSTLVNELATQLRKAGRTVGIVAVDPTSPYTGGALLGDRIRMERLGLDAGVFMRSMATRGTLGGLARATCDACDLLDASGKDAVLVESVGVGQSEVEVTHAVDLTLVVLSPESGDSVQAMKAGLLEAADLIVINKADRPGAERMEGDLRDVLAISRPATRPAPSIFRTTAAEGIGVPELLAAIDEKWNELSRDGRLAERRRENLAARLRASVLAEVERLLDDDHASDGAVGKLQEGKAALTEATEEVLAALKQKLEDRFC